MCPMRSASSSSPSNTICWSSATRGFSTRRSTNQILDDLVAACGPRRMTVVGDFTARGGITTKVTADSHSRESAVKSSAASRQFAVQWKTKTPVDIPIEDAIDLHSFAPRDVISVVDEYLHAARDAGFSQVRLIHGRGKGVQRADIQRLLRDHALVDAVLGCAGVAPRRDVSPFAPGAARLTWVSSCPETRRSPARSCRSGR